MKFAEKYEILEMVTSGRVSTFLARERASQESVVVYTFDCSGTGAGELSTASIISRFCALAPNPPGMIVKAGFDQPSSSAFIATKMPDSEALKGWVRAYQSFGKPADGGPVSDATMELDPSEVQSAVTRSGVPQSSTQNQGKNTPSKPPTVAEIGEELIEGTAFSLGGPSSGQSAGEFTRLFREVNAFEPMQRSPAPAPPKASDVKDAGFGQRLGGSALGGEKFAPPQPVAPTPAEPGPGAFTREFLGIPAEKVDPAPRQSPAPAPPPQQQNEPGAFTREFMAISQPGPKSPERPAPSEFAPTRPSAPASATSFDSIFGSGSSQPVSQPPSQSRSSQPSSSTGSFGSEAESPKGGAGEFTSFFRDPFDHPGAPAKSNPMPDLASTPPPQKQSGDFTRMFGAGEIDQARDASPPPEERQPAASSFTQLFGEISLGPAKGSQLGGGIVDTNPNARPSFLEPSPAPPPAPPAPPPLDPFRGGMSSTPVAPPLDPFFSRTPVATPPAAANTSFMNRAGSSEATNVFKVPGGDAPPVEPLPSGPSDFTMFLSRSQLNAAMAPPEPSAGGAGPPPPNPFQFAPPPVPAPPAIKLPKAPAMPEVPRPAAGLPKAGSFWPLITVLTILLAIGAILVMYFVLKH